MMKIIEIYNNSTKPVYSFEFFPPKTPEGEEKLKGTIKDLKELNPAFVSVTYGAGGSTRDKTIELCSFIQDNFSITSMCHFTCVGADKNQIRQLLKLIESKKIENVIALRGDPPAGQGKFLKVPDGFGNATELTSFIKSEGFQFCIAGGAYPEKHPDSPTPEDDIHFLKLKNEAGADFFITQLFFSNKLFFEFLGKAKNAGISAPIIPGIMPITNFNQIQRFRDLANCYIPDDLVKELEKVKENKDEFLKISLQFTVNQCKDLIANNVKGIHFYTLNQSDATIQILKQLI
ncbi:MAG: methylenetetrahydrofolate reductase [NAD(P)H] [Leptospiraceae bacterium]|nr:methylenetetrahydrofolate reductase [NAD(P)H] [Leptospiraceae bacterium]